MTENPSPIAAAMVEFSALAERKQQLELELAQVCERMNAIMGKGAGKRSLESQIKHAGEMMELDRRCQARDPATTTEKRVIMQFIVESLQAAGRRESNAKSLYPKYRRALSRWREKFRS